jgi:NitT/TauT family transport system ATP-binding protein
MIRVSNLTKIYPANDGGTLTALQDINLDIHDHEFVTIVGKSGCGKTTLLKLIAGLLTPTNGTVTVDGNPSSGSKSEIGMVFQNALLLPWLNVLNNILLPIDVLHKGRSDYLATAYELLDLVGLEDCATRFPRELSGGMQQRVAICRAFIHDPKLLVMDEPFASLDALTREVMGTNLMRICTSRQKTVIFVTHSITEAILLADRVVVMTPQPGRIAKIITIELPKPRIAEMEFTEAFRSHQEEIHSLIFRKRLD